MCYCTLVYCRVFGAQVQAGFGKNVPGTGAAGATGPPGLFTSIPQLPRRWVYLILARWRLNLRRTAAPVVYLFILALCIYLNPT